MTRPELHRLAQARLDDASVLLAGGRWAAAYYLTGYAVECGLKACVLRHIDATGAIFRDQKYLRNLANCWTHDLSLLVTLAGLDAEFGAARGANPSLNRFWGVTTGWTEASRYEERTEIEARALLEAVGHNPDGVLRWIHSRW